MHKKFEINRTEIKVGCQLGRKVVPHDSKSYLPLVSLKVVKCNYRCPIHGFLTFTVPGMAASFGMASYFVNPYAAYAATNGSHVVSRKILCSNA